MDNIILISTNNLTLEKIQSIIQSKKLLFEKKNVLHYGDYFSFITFILYDKEDIISEYSKKKLNVIHNRIPNPIMYVVDSNDIKLLKSIILELSLTQEELLIDNTIDKIMNVSEFEKIHSFKELFR